jgi:hypothetical protein
MGTNCGRAWIQSRAPGHPPEPPAEVGIGQRGAVRDACGKILSSGDEYRVDPDSHPRRETEPSFPTLRRRPNIIVMYVNLYMTPVCLL